MKSSDGAIQLSRERGFMATTNARGYLKCIEVEWASGKDDSSINIRGVVVDNNRIKEIDLAPNKTPGDLLGALSTSNTTFNIDKEVCYVYIAVTKNMNAVYINRIIFEWDVSNEGDGTLDSPYTFSDMMKFWKTNSQSLVSNEVWLEAQILEDSKSGDTDFKLNNVYPRFAVQIPLDIQSYIGAKSNPENINKTIRFFAKIPNGINYAGSKIRGLADTLSIQHDEGFGTYYNTVPYEMPDGMEGGVVADAKDGSLVVDYQYKAGSIVPAGVPLLIKSEATGKFDVSIVAPTASTTKPEKNLLYGAKDVDENGKTFVAGNDVKYFILSRDRNGQNLGFYYGAENGAPVSYQSPYAFLALPAETSQSIKSFSLDGATTGMEGIPVSGIVPATAIYTITGVKVSGSLDRLPSGIYIVDGKKIIIN